MDDSPIGSFRVLGTLGKGAHSSILHVRRDKDSRQYALKVVPIGGREDQKYLKQAEHEFRVAQMLNHRNLIKIFKLELQKNLLFRVRKVLLLIEYVNGQTLDKVRGLTLPLLVQVFERVADGLVQMHRRRVFHADIKPSNILLSRSGQVKIIDYGLAWIQGQAKHRVQGTIEYMAPEQAHRQIVNAQTDIYNLGATMYRMVTWRHPPQAIAATEGLPMDAKTFHSLLKPAREYNPDVPKELCELIHQCLSFKPQKRPERISEVQGALDRLSDKMVADKSDMLENFEWE